MNRISRTCQSVGPKLASYRIEACASVRTLACLLLFWGIPTALLLGAEQEDAPQFLVEYYSIEDGLPQNNVYDIMQDRRGFMWFATRDGICRYDAYEFSTIRHTAMAEGLASPNVELMAESGKGDFWLSFGNRGLQRLDRRNGFSTFYRRDSSLTGALLSDLVLSLRADSAGIVWAGTSAGLNRYDPESDSFDEIALLPADMQGAAVSDLTHGRNGKLWALCNREALALWLPEREHLQVLHHFPGWQKIIGLDAEQNVCIVRPKGLAQAEDALLHRYDWRASKLDSIMPADFDNLPTLFEREHFSQIFGLEQNGSFWRLVMTNSAEQSGSGIYYFDMQRRTAQLVIPLDFDRHGSVFAFHQSNRGTVWIGTRRGLYKVKQHGSGFAHYARRESAPDSSAAPGLGSNFIRSLHYSSADSLWVGTENGLYLKHGAGSAWSHFSFSGLKIVMATGNVINCIYPDSLQGFLLGSNAGLLKIDTQQKMLYQVNAAPENAVSIWAIFRDERKRLWLGTHGGEIIISDSLGRHEKVVSAATHSSAEFTAGLVWEILQAADGQVWVATSLGVNRLIDPDGLKFQTYLAAGQPGNSTGSSDIRQVGDNVCALFEDAAGTIWAVSYGGGPSYYDSALDRFVPAPLREDQRFNTLYGMLQDRSGRYWFSGNQGLLCWDKSLGLVHEFGPQDGLQGLEFSFRAYASDGSDKMAFGGINGLNEFDPIHVRSDSFIPPVVISAVKVFDTLRVSEPWPTDQMEFEYSENFISFEFSALDFISTERQRYAYRLEGFSDKWTYCGTRRFAGFTNLDPGDYRFMVNTVGRDDLSQNAASVSFSVATPYWQTWWFRVAVVLAGIALIATVIYRRTHALLLQNRLRRRLLEARMTTLRLQMNPHFIFNTLGSIEYLILQRDVQGAAHYLREFGDLVREILEHSSHSTISLESELNALRMYLNLQTLRFQEKFSFELHVEPQIDKSAIQIPPLVFQPYIENALKHGQVHKREGGRVELTISLQDEKLYCRIEDNGIGRHAARQNQRRHKQSVKLEPNQMADQKLEARPGTNLGTSVTAERIRLLNARRRQQISTKISDIIAPDGAVRGTRVELWFALEKLQVTQ